MLKLDNTLDQTQKGTHQKAPKKMKDQNQQLNVKSSMDKVMARQDHPNVTRKPLRRLWPNSSVATLRGPRML